MGQGEKDTGAPGEKQQAQGPMPKFEELADTAGCGTQASSSPLALQLREALEREAATAEILRVIASSPANVGPIFEAIAERSNKLVSGLSTAVYHLIDDMLHLAAFTRRDEIADAALIDLFPRRLSDIDWYERTIREARPVQVEDSEVQFAHQPGLLDLSRKRGFRSAALIPLLHDSGSIGIISVTRAEPGKFRNEHIRLLQTFADQAVIAIENVRLFDEVQQKTRDLEESLQQQTTTADVLKVISRSAFDLDSVMNTLTQSAAELCKAEISALYLREGDVLVVRGVTDMDAGKADFLRRTPLQVNSLTYVGRAILAGSILNIANVDTETDIGFLKRFGEVLGFKAILFVPLTREGRGIGVFALGRKHTGQFSQREVDLVQTFADQAVIAIENVRLFDETQARTKELAISLDNLRAAQDRLVQTEKLASLGQLTAGIAHEIKNPLNFVNNFAALSAELTDELNDTLKIEPLSEKARLEVDELTGLLKDNLEKVVQHGRRADSIVKNMLLHSREGSGERRSANINALVEDSLSLAYHGARAEKPGFNITIKHDCDPDAGELDLYPQEVTRALLNLISNGFYAATKRKSESGDETFEPMLSAATRSLGSWVEIRVRDNGTGIPPEVKAKIFNPFFTTKPTGEGTGLGLSMSHDIIVKQHGGTIDVETEPGVFTEFVIRLPR